MTENKYSKTAIYLHWIIAVLMIVNVSLGWIADSLPDAWIRLTIDTHKSIGISVLCLVLMRVLWRIGHKPPALPDSFKVWEKKLSHLGHWGAVFIDVLGANLRLVARLCLERCGDPSDATFLHNSLATHRLH